MTPVSLKLHNFLSYGEDVPALDFTAITTACLTGDNGHGKSALLDAVTWALWGETRAKGIDDVVRLGQQDCQVEFTFDLETDRYRVIRKRSLRTKAGMSALELQGLDPESGDWRSLSGSTIRETEARITQLLRMNHETFVNSVFILQGRADEFTTRRPGERKRILAEILGLTVFDDLQAKARARAARLDANLARAAERLHELEEQVARKPALQADLEACRQNLASLDARLRETRGRLDDLRRRRLDIESRRRRLAELADRLDRLAREQAEIDPQVHARQETLAACRTLLDDENAIGVAWAELRETRRDEADLARAAEGHARLEARIATLENGVAQARQRLELELGGARRHEQDLQGRRARCEAILAEEPAVSRDAAALARTRERETAMAETLQARYAAQQEKSRLEGRIRERRHALDIEHRSLRDRHEESRGREAALPDLQAQAATLTLNLGADPDPAGRLEEAHAAQATVAFQLDQELPQRRRALDAEIDDWRGKRRLLDAAHAACPLCETALSDADRLRVIDRLQAEVDSREALVADLEKQAADLREEQDRLRSATRDLAARAERRRDLARQMAETESAIETAAAARNLSASLLKSLSDLEARINSGDYARDDIDALTAVQARLDALAYDADAHAALRRDLDRLAGADARLERLAQAKADLQDLDAQLAAVRNEASSLQAALDDESYAEDERRALGEARTDRARLGYDAPRHAELRRRLREAHVVERRHAELQTARQRLEETRAALQGLQARAERLAQEARQLEAERRLTLQAGDSLDEVDAQLARTDALAADLAREEGDTRLALGRTQSQYDLCLQNEARLAAEKEARQEAQAERRLYADLDLILGRNGVQALIIENALPELEDEANRILGRVTDNRMHVKLETQRDTRAGTALETLDIKISDDLGTRDYELFSGGEAFRINVALRIALSRMLARRAGARLRTLVIDEGFGTQDSNGLERLVEVIKAIRQDFDKIIVITHLPELKSAFETHVEVVKDPVSGSSYRIR